MPVTLLLLLLAFGESCGRAFARWELGVLSISMALGAACAARALSAHCRSVRSATMLGLGWARLCIADSEPISAKHFPRAMFFPGQAADIAAGQRGDTLISATTVAIGFSALLDCAKQRTALLVIAACGNRSSVVLCTCILLGAWSGSAAHQCLQSASSGQ